MDLTSDVGSVGGGPKLSKKDRLKRYRDCIDITQRWREAEQYDQTWDRLRDLYAGKQFTQLSHEDRIAVNIAFATVNVIEPSIAVNHPKITVSARNFEDDDKAVITEAIVNYWWRHYDFKPEFRRAVKDYLVYGHGWLKVGWHYKEVLEPLSDEEFADRFHLAKAEADMYAEANPELAGQLPTDDEILANVDPLKRVTTKDCPFVERVSPYDIFVDPEATSESDMKYIAQRIRRPLEEVKKDKRYPSAVRKNLQPDSEVTKDWRDKNKQYDKDAIKRVTLWEFYDLEAGILAVFAETGDRFLVDPIPMPYAYGIPFVMLRNYNVPDRFYPIGDLEALIPLQDELNETRSSMVAARKQDIPKTWYRKSLNSDAVDGLRSKNRGELIGVEDDRPAGELFGPVPNVNVNPQLYQHSDQILADVDRISGVSEYQRGAIPETRRTATEASIIQDAANARAADKLATIEYVIAEVAERVVMLGKQYITQQQVARVTGTANQQVWVPYSRRDIVDEADFVVEAGSTQPMNESFRRQQAMQLLNSMAPFLDSGLINVPAMLQYVLQYGFGIPNSERFISMTPPAPEGPDVKLVETMAYKDVPPSIQAQIEAAAGFQPASPQERQQNFQAEHEERLNTLKGQKPEKKNKTDGDGDPAALGAQATQRLNGT